MSDSAHTRCHPAPQNSSLKTSIEQVIVEIAGNWVNIDSAGGGVASLSATILVISSGAERSRWRSQARNSGFAAPEMAGAPPAICVSNWCEKVGAKGSLISFGRAPGGAACGIGRALYLLLMCRPTPNTNI